METSRENDVRTLTHVWSPQIKVSTYKLPFRSRSNLKKFYLMDGTANMGSGFQQKVTCSKIFRQALEDYVAFPKLKGFSQLSTWQQPTHSSVRGELFVFYLKMDWTNLAWTDTDINCSRVFTEKKWTTKQTVFKWSYCNIQQKPKFSVPNSCDKTLGCSFQTGK